MSDAAPKDMKTKGRPKVEAPPSLPMAVSKLIGLYLGALGLVGTYVVAWIGGVSAETALWRAILVFLTLLVLGRILGFFVGRILARQLEPNLVSAEEVRS